MKTKNPASLKKFIIVTWIQDEGGLNHPITMPLLAASKLEIETAISKKKKKLHNRKLPPSEAFEDFGGPKFLILSLDEFFKNPPVSQFSDSDDGGEEMMF